MPPVDQCDRVLPGEHGVAIFTGELWISHLGHIKLKPSRPLETFWLGVPTESS